LRNDTEVKQNTHPESATSITDDFHHVKAGDDYCKMAIHPWAQGQKRCHEHLPLYLGQQIKEIRGHVDNQTAQTEQALAK
jgi:hypothetical protein